MADPRRTDRVTGAIVVSAPGRTDRFAGAIIALEALPAFGIVGLMLVRYLPELGSADAHLAGDAALSLILAAPIAVGGLAVGTLAVLVWRGSSGARRVAAGAAAVATVLVAASTASYGNPMWVVREFLLARGGMSVEWPYWVYDPFGARGAGDAVSRFPNGRLDDIGFWYPAIVALGALLVGGLLLAGWIARRRASATPA